MSRSPGEHSNRLTPRKLLPGIPLNRSPPDRTRAHRCRGYRIFYKPPFPHHLPLHMRDSCHCHWCRCYFQEKETVEDWCYHSLFRTYYRACFDYGRYFLFLIVSPSAGNPDVLLADSLNTSFNRVCFSDHGNGFSPRGKEAVQTIISLVLSSFHRYRPKKWIREEDYSGVMGADR